MGVVTSIEQKNEGEKSEIIKDYKSKIECELVEICNDILGTIEESLIPNSTSEEAKVFYYKMKGDYHRYLSEFQTGDTRRNPPEPLWMLTKQPVELPNLTFPQRIQSVSVWLLTFPSFTMRSSTHPTKRATLRSKHSTMPLRNLTLSTKNPTRIRH